MTSELDHKTTEKIIAGVRRGLPWRSAAVLAGVYEREHRDWEARANRGEEPFVRFFERVTLAEIELEAELVGRVRLAAARGNEQAARWLHDNIRARRLARERVTAGPRGDGRP